MGANLALDAVPLRESGMEPFEILTSESQERMLAIVRPDDVGAVLDVCTRWGLEASRVGTLARGGALRVTHDGEEVAAVPTTALADEGPEYDRPRARPGWLDERWQDDPGGHAFDGSLEEAFLAVLSSPNVASMRWAFEQYDSIVGGGTVVGPGMDAAVVRLEGSVKAVALSAEISAARRRIASTVRSPAPART